MSIFNNKYPYTDFHEMNLDWFLLQFKNLVTDWETFRETITNQWNEYKTQLSGEWNEVQEAWKVLYNYVHDYFDNLDVQEEINNKLDTMVEDGTFSRFIAMYYPFVTPQMFGAKADGVTDDTDAIQTAINTNRNVFFPMTNQERYRITRTITVSGRRQSLYGDVFSHNWSTPYNTPRDVDKHGYIMVDFDSSMEDVPAFHFSCFINNVANLNIVNPNSDSSVQYGTAFKWQRTIDDDITNIDSEINNCTIRGFKVAIDLIGRGFNCHDNMFYGNRTDVHINIAKDDKWINSPTDNNILEAYPKYSGRCILIKNNRHHVNRLYLVHAEGEETVYQGETLYPTLQACQIIGNEMDLGAGYYRFDCNVDNSIIADNILYRCRSSYCIKCAHTISNTLINNNVFGGDVNPDVTLEGLPDYFIQVFEFIDSTISNNIFSYCKQIGIWGDTTSNWKGLVISGNTFKDWGYSQGTEFYRVCIMLNNASDILISNNLFKTSNNSIRNCVRYRNKSTNVWTDVKITNNILPYGDISNEGPIDSTRVVIENNN